MRYAIKMFGLVLVAALSACGRDDGGGFDTFVGTWKPTSGTGTTICPGYAPFTSTASGNIVWSAGVSSDLVMTDPSGCLMLADVRGTTATAFPGQTCTASDGAGGVSTASFTGYTFIVSPDGRNATENASATITFIDQGASIVCSGTSTISYQKISN